MPIYEFTCKACGEDSEILVRSGDGTGEKCASCGSSRLVKKLSVFAVAAHDHAAHADLPPCAGDPSACGRCHMN